MPEPNDDSGKSAGEISVSYAEMSVSYEDCPESKGRIWVVPLFEDNSRLYVDIVADPEGLQHLADCFTYLARFDQEARGHPSGTRAHLHFRPRTPGTDCGQLGTHSCPLTVWRAEAAHTGEIYGQLDKLQEEEDRYAEDHNPATEWLEYATSALVLARESFSHAGKGQEQAAPLSAHAVYCAIMAGLRAREIPVAECVDYPQQILRFVPDGLPLPLEEDALCDILMDDEMARPERTGFPTPDEEELRAALDAAEKLVAWARRQVGGT
jgi:hypothetical protein